jgi:hypothetical protein
MDIRARAGWMGQLEKPHASRGAKDEALARKKTHRLKSVLLEIPRDHFEGFGVAGSATRSAKDFSSDGTQISSINSSFGRSFIIL